MSRSQALLCAPGAQVGLLIAIAAASYSVLFFRFGWDIRAYCQLVSIWAQRLGSPYDPQVFAREFHGAALLSYPPFMLPLLGVLSCGSPVFPFLVYVACYSCLAYLNWTDHKNLLCQAVLAFGFAAVPLVFASGNLQLVDTLAVTAALWGIRRNRWMTAGFLIGCSTAIKLQSGLMVPLMLVFCASARERRRFIYGFVAVTAAALAICLIFFTSLSFEFLLMVRHQLVFEGRYSLFLHALDPSLWKFLQQLLPAAQPSTIRSVALTAYLVLYICAVGVVIKGRGRFPALMLAILLSLVCFPRLAIYSYTLACYPLNVLLTGMSRRAGGLLSALVVLPSACLAVTFRPDAAMDINFTILAVCIICGALNLVATGARRCAAF